MCRLGDILGATLSGILPPPPLRDVHRDVSNDGLDARASACEWRAARPDTLIVCLPGDIKNHDDSLFFPGPGSFEAVPFGILKRSASLPKLPGARSSRLLLPVPPSVPANAQPRPCSRPPLDTAGAPHLKTASASPKRRLIPRGRGRGCWQGLPGHAGGGHEGGRPGKAADQEGSVEGHACRWRDVHAHSLQVLRQIKLQDKVENWYERERRGAWRRMAGRPEPVLCIVFACCSLAACRMRRQRPPLLRRNIGT